MFNSKEDEKSTTVEIKTKVKLKHTHFIVIEIRNTTVYMVTKNSNRQSGKT